MQIKIINIEDSLKQSYLDYSMSVIVGRALPEAKDSLKPIHRLAETLFEYMLNNNLIPNIPTYSNVNIKYFQNKIANFNTYNFISNLSNKTLSFIKIQKLLI